MQTHSLQNTTLSFHISASLQIHCHHHRLVPSVRSILLTTAFLTDLKQTSLVTNPSESLSHLVDLY